MQPLGHLDVAKVAANATVGVIGIPGGDVEGDAEGQNQNAVETTEVPSLDHANKDKEKDFLDKYRRECVSPLIDPINQNYAQAKTFMRTPCNHKYHKTCLLDWMKN